MKGIMALLTVTHLITRSALAVPLVDIPDPHHHSRQGNSNEAAIESTLAIPLVLVTSSPNGLDQIVPAKQGRERTYIRQTVPSPDNRFQAYVIVQSDGELYSEHLYLEDKGTGEIFKLEERPSPRLINVMWATNRYLVFDQRQPFYSTAGVRPGFVPIRTLHYTVDAHNRAVVKIMSYTATQ